jgi:hypothetical protein
VVLVSITQENDIRATGEHSVPPQCYRSSNARPCATFPRSPAFRAAPILAVSEKSWLVRARRPLEADARDPEPTPIFQVWDVETKRTIIYHAYRIVSHEPNEPLDKGEACLLCR